jgi:Haem-binding domain
MALSPRLKKLLKIGVVGGIVVFVGLQFAPVGKLGIHVEEIGANPPERFKIDAPPEVEAVLRRTCFDCHTNETRWPLYARIAPGSWLMARDIHTGRSHINLSKWADADEEERQTDRENMWEQIESGAMPPWFYIYPFHLDARLSAADKALLKSYLMKDAGKKTEETKEETKEEPKK